MVLNSRNCCIAIYIFQYLLTKVFWELYNILLYICPCKAFQVSPTVYTANPYLKQPDNQTIFLYYICAHYHLIVPYTVRNIPKKDAVNMKVSVNWIHLEHLCCNMLIISRGIHGLKSNRLNDKSIQRTDQILILQVTICIPH